LRGGAAIVWPPHNPATQRRAGLMNSENPTSRSLFLPCMTFVCTNQGTAGGVRAKPSHRRNMIRDESGNGVFNFLALLEHIIRGRSSSSRPIEDRLCCYGTYVCVYHVSSPRMRMVVLREGVSHSPRRLSLSSLGGGSRSSAVEACNIYQSV